MKSLKVQDFNLKYTLECGQFFRFKESDGHYYVNTKDKFFKIKQEGDTLYYKGNIDEKFLIHFFRLDEDYKKIISNISKDKFIRLAVKKYPGLRLIRQDPYECTISYICSSASNIPKIQKNIALLSEHFGKEMNHDGICTHAFPKPGCINDLSKIKASSTGFRARYIYEANKMLTSKFLKKLEKLPYDGAKKELVTIPGIGDKVADCILLFSLDHEEAFPVDVWIKRIIEQLYFDNQEVPVKKIREFAKEHFKENAGYAQQFLYYFAREKNDFTIYQN